MSKEADNPEENYLAIVNRKLDKITVDMEKLGIAEYLQILREPRRLLIFNFWAGVVRGFGMAIGFTILAAIVIYFLKRIILLNIPVIGKFIADVVEIVQTQLKY